LKAAKIIAKQVSTIPGDSHLKSHFGGQPYFEKGEKWPTTKAGYPLGFVFQIYNENNALPENIKLLQFFIDWEDIPWRTEEDGWLVKIYEKPNPDNFQLIKKPEENDQVNYCEIRLKTIKSLPDEEGQLSSQLGGYPHWLQGDKTPKKDNFDFLFQLDSLEDEVEGLYFYDCGVVYVFYDSKSKEFEFVLQCC